MEFKGTKGKWYNETNVSVSIFHPTNIGQRICTVICGEPTEEDFANAQLIAHAPEMLEMLNKCSEFLTKVQAPKTSAIYLSNEIEQLITKATTIK